MNGGDLVTWTARRLDPGGPSTEKATSADSHPAQFTYPRGRDRAFFRGAACDPEQSIQQLFGYSDAGQPAGQTSARVCKHPTSSRSHCEGLQTRRHEGAAHTTVRASVEIRKYEAAHSRHTCDGALSVTARLACRIFQTSLPTRWSRLLTSSRSRIKWRSRTGPRRRRASRAAIRPGRTVAAVRRSANRRTWSCLTRMGLPAMRSSAGTLPWSR